MAQQIDVEATLSKLSLKERVLLLSGQDFWHTASLKKHGIESVRVSDGPNGVRGTQFFMGAPASCFPCSTGLASSFNTELAERVGEALGNECRSKGVHVLLAPTVNMQRSPLGGRGFESFSEDPHLSGFIAASYINGVQAKKVGVSLKHFVCNDCEHERFANDSVVSSRALREIYLEPFRLAIKHGSPRTIMTAYNRVNGTHCSESPFLLQHILRGEWGWNGLVMSDWTGTYSTGESIRAGLDLEMPGPTVMRGSAVMRQIQAGKLSVKDVDDRAREVLRLFNSAVESGIPFNKAEEPLESEHVRETLLAAATEAIVLLKNDKLLLPLDSPRSVAVIGTASKLPVPSGGGSAALRSTYTISPLQAIETVARNQGCKVEYAEGAVTYRFMPLLDHLMVQNSTSSGGLVQFYSGAPIKDWWNDLDTQLPAAVYEVHTTTSNCFMIDGIPYDNLGPELHCRMTTSVKADRSGIWSFGLCSIGWSRLYINGHLVIDNTKNWAQGEIFFRMGSEEARGSFELKAGESYEIEIRQYFDPNSGVPSPFLPRNAFRAGGYPDIDEREAIQEAVELARTSEITVVMVGTNMDYESEGFDRKNMELPGASNSLVEAVLAANPRTIVITQSGTSISMPWASHASTVVHAFFGGNEGGTAIADVLFGRSNPSGKLSLTFPQRLEDNPTFLNFGITSPEPGKSIYGEGIFVGYRHYDASKIEPLFPFGHGLSYSTFAYDHLAIHETDQSRCDFEVHFSISNTSNVDGAEVAQVFVSAPDGTRPVSAPKELKGFAKKLIRAGQSETFRVKLDKSAFSFWDDSRDAWHVAPGKYTISVGSSSRAVHLTTQINIEQTVLWRGL